MEKNVDLILVLKNMEKNADMILVFKETRILLQI